MKNELPPFFYGILRILDCGFMVEEGFEPDLDNIKTGYAMNFLFDIPNNWIQYLLRVDFRDEKTGVTFISSTVQTMFSIRDLKYFVDADDKINFPEGSLETLFGIAFGHLRAICAKNVAGSKYSQVYVPVVDANVVFNDLLKLNIQKFNEAVERGDVELVKKPLKQEDKQDIPDIVLATKRKATKPPKEPKRVAK